MDQLLLYMRDALQAYSKAMTYKPEPPPDSLCYHGDLALDQFAHPFPEACMPSPLYLHSRMGACFGCPEHSMMVSMIVWCSDLTGSSKADSLKGAGC